MLPAQSHIHAVVLLQSQLAGRLQHVLARAAHRRLLSVLQQLVHQPDRAVPGQRHVPQALRQTAVLVVRQVAGRGDRDEERLHAPEKRHPGKGPDDHQRVDDHSQRADEHVHQTHGRHEHHHHRAGQRAPGRQHHHIMGMTPLCCYHVPF